MKFTKTNDSLVSKTSRADIHYVPQVKDLKDAMYVGDLSKEEDKKSLLKILDNHYPNESKINSVETA